MIMNVIPRFAYPWIIRCTLRIFPASKPEVGSSKIKNSGSRIIIPPLKQTVAFDRLTKLLGAGF